MVTREEFGEAAAVAQFLTRKKNLTLQESFDLHSKVVDMLLYRIQQLELRVKVLENK